MRYFGFNKPSFSMRRFGFAFIRFTPADLFLNGEQGVWFDPSDLSTMFQDVDGLEPVTKDGDPVALIRDKSGNDNHATQPTASARPIYRTDGKLHWIEGDGVDDILRTKKVFALKSGMYMAVKLGARFPVVSNTTQTVFGAAESVYYFRTSLRALSEGHLVLSNGIRYAGTLYESTHTSYDAETHAKPILITSRYDGERVFFKMNHQEEISTQTDLQEVGHEAVPVQVLDTRNNNARFYGGIWVGSDLTPEQRAGVEDYMLGSAK